jgi:hypothetical protein
VRRLRPRVVGEWGPCLEGGVDGHAVLAQDGGVEHGDQLEQQVRLSSKHVREAALHHLPPHQRTGLRPPRSASKARRGEATANRTRGHKQTGRQRSAQFMHSRGGGLSLRCGSRARVERTSSNSAAQEPGTPYHFLGSPLDQGGQPGVRHGARTRAGTTASTSELKIAGVQHAQDMMVKVLPASFSLQRVCLEKV